jgi:hypothetical protein
MATKRPEDAAAIAAYSGGILCALCEVDMRNLPASRYISLVQVARLQGCMAKKYQSFSLCSFECAANLPYLHELPYIADAIRARINSHLDMLIQREDLHAMRNGKVISAAEAADITVPIFSKRRVA